mmetsp:Transcript_4587/g.8941  ORF Transcript_4587/g.8941 Transcript_4587/m.8941 type:complete len:91 (+) Transcript_4587:1113-1385(+)
MPPGPPLKLGVRPGLSISAASSSVPSHRAVVQMHNRSDRTQKQSRLIVAKAVILQQLRLVKPSDIAVELPRILIDKDWIRPQQVSICNVV